MSFPVFVVADLAGEKLRVDGAEGRHAVTVKRIVPGEKVKLIDGSGAWAVGEATETSGKDTLIVTVVERGVDAPPRPSVTIIQALPKSERSELAVDLMTQAGADEIIAWQAERSIAKWTATKADKHLKKWRDTAQAAAKQARRTRIPEVSGPLTTAQVAALIDGETAYVLHEDAEAKLTEVEVGVDKLFLLVGPEGGIGADELERLGAVPVRLGPEVYRTASAAMVALAALGATTRW